MKTRSQGRAEFDDGIDSARKIRKTKKIVSRRRIESINESLKAAKAAGDASANAMKGIEGNKRIVYDDDDDDDDNDFIIMEEDDNNDGDAKAAGHARKKNRIIYDIDRDRVTSTNTSWRDPFWRIGGLDVRKKQLYGEACEATMRANARIHKDYRLIRGLICTIFKGESLKNKIDSMYSTYKTYSMYLNNLCNFWLSVPTWRLVNSERVEERRLSKYRAAREALEENWEDTADAICRYASINIKGRKTVVDAKDLLVPISFSLAPKTVSVLEPRRDFIETLSTPHEPSMASQAAHMSTEEDQDQAKVSTDYIFYENTIEGNEPEPPARADPRGYNFIKIFDSKDLGYEDPDRDVKLSTMVNRRIKSIDDTLKRQYEELTKRLINNRKLLLHSEQLMNLAASKFPLRAKAEGLDIWDVMHKVKKGRRLYRAPPNPIFHRGCVINGKPVDVKKILRSKGDLPVPSHVFCDHTDCCDPKTFVDLEDLGLGDRKIAVDVRIRDKDIDAKDMANIVDISYQGENPEGFKYLLTPEISINGKKIPKEIAQEIAQELKWVEKLRIFTAERWQVKIPATNPETLAEEHKVV